ncbi:unnamed protein product [Tilletia controversa]|nr:unnamed protein product [Tilletia controversa]
MTEVSFASSAATPLKNETAPPQEKVPTDTSLSVVSSVLSSTPVRTQSKKMSDRERGKKVPPQSLYKNPEMAALSTPEIHLASSALTGTEDQTPDAGFTQRWHGLIQKGRQSPTEAKSSAYSSIGTVMNSTNKTTTSKRGHSANDTIDSTGSNTARRPSSQMSRQSKTSPEPGSSSRSFAGLFTRQRRWSQSATQTGEAIVPDDVDTLEAADRSTVLGNDEEMTELLDDDEYEPPAPSAYTAASTKVSATTAATSALSKSSAKATTITPHLREEMHEAVAFLHQELSKLTGTDLNRYKPRILQLGHMVRSQSRQLTDTELQGERLNFWLRISDGILLCMLIVRLAPAKASELPDRFPSQSSVTANFNFFLRAARQTFGLSPNDLFQVQDVTAQTPDGLQRVVHSILTLRARCQRNGTVRSETSPPRTPITSIPEGGEMAMPIPFPTDVSKGMSASPHRRSLSAVQENRLLAERKLMGHRADGDSPGSSRQRKISNVTSSQRTPTVQIVELARDDANTTGGSSLYRDRKASESVVSLTGVLEEESEAGDADISAAFSSPDVSADFSSSRIGLSTSPKLGMGTPAGRPTANMRRLSTDLGLGRPSARHQRLSFDGSSELPFPIATGSPRLGPVRRHSAIARAPGPSSLNPNREMVPSGSLSEVGLDSTPRVPFPRSNSAYDSPSRRPGSGHGRPGSGHGVTGRFGSTSGTATGSEIRAAPNSDVGMGSTSSPSRTRPPVRHTRYSSDLHLPNHTRPAGHSRSEVSSADPQPPPPRPRFDSEATSVFTAVSFPTSTQEDGVRPRIHRESTVQSKHKLVVDNDGEPVTYQIGQCIGKGQFGSVYKAMNTATGNMLAVKRIKLTGKTEREITQLMQEVDLLKKLEHPSVVKYEGLVRSNDVLNIILEWVESGSLYLTLKAFGPFQEALCASYVVQILEGLNYLHFKQVVHCDLKAANILTTKRGNIKLSDFGVSLNLQAMATRKDAVGTPNWMAPEVITLAGASTASDIWSLGCTIVEMMTGKPPYHDLNGLQAMYRIAEDGCPPLPPNISELLRDFLLQCFQKEPENRPSAEVLFEHEWLKHTWPAHKQLKTKDSVPFLRRISADLRRVDLDTIDAGNETSMERSSSSPPESMARRPSPGVGPIPTAFYPSSAGGSRAPHSQSVDNFHMPAPAPLRMGNGVMAIARHGSDAEGYFGHGQVASTPSPHVDQNGFLNPSFLELNGTPIDVLRPHQFVKISFSKPVTCKMCYTHVKKHAVYCEGCGLVGHPSCASSSETSCTAQAPVVPIGAGTRSSNERRRGVGSRTEVGSPSSPMMQPVFRFPFIRNRRNSSALTTGSESPGLLGKSSPPLPPPSPMLSADGSGANRDASGKRRRRISLANLVRHRSVSPGFSSPEILRSPSETSTRVFPVTQVIAARMGGSLSSSGSSTLSRVPLEASEMSKAQTEVVNQTTLGTVPPGMISTPTLVGRPKGVLYGIGFPRRLSDGASFAQNEGAKSRTHIPGHSISVVYTRDTENSDITPGPVIEQADRKRFKRTSKECTIM